MGFFHQFWQLTIDGLASGSLYAVVAIGYTLVYGVLQLINFAHSEVFMFGGFAGLFAVRGLASGGSSGWNSAGLIAFGLFIGAIAGGLAAFVLERTAYAPLRRRGAPKLAYLISAIGASYFAFNLAGKEFGRQNVPAPNLYSDKTVVFHIFKGAVSLNALLVFTIAIAMLFITDRTVRATKMGKSIRAVAQDADTASLMGINVNKVIVFTFVLGGLLAGAGGYLFAQVFVANYTMGFLPGIKAFTAAVLGGIGNVRGAMLGGLILGVVESYGGDLLGGQYRDVIAFVVLILVLMFRPQGLLGERLGRSA